MALTKCNFLPLDGWVQVHLGAAHLHSAPSGGACLPLSLLSLLSLLSHLSHPSDGACLSSLTHLMTLVSHFFASFPPLQSTYLLVQLVIVTATAIRSQRTTEQHLSQASRLSQCQFRSVFAVLILGKTCFSQFKFFSWSE